jgi:hypothetical protein
LFGIVACVFGSLVSAFVLFAGGEPFSFNDLLGFSSLSFVPALLLCALLYAPALLWLRRRRAGCRPAFLFPVLSGLLLNLPVLLLMLAAAWKGKFFSGTGEVVIFAAAFITTGALFGVGFVVDCRRRMNLGVST